MHPKRKLKDFATEIIPGKRRRIARLILTSMLLCLELACESVAGPGSTSLESGDLRELVPEMWSRSRNGGRARLVSWFHPQPVPLGSDELTAEQLLVSLTFRDEMETHHPYCWYGSGIVHVSVGKRRSGCFEHELGHAALHMTGYSNWRCFEHPEKNCR